MIRLTVDGQKLEARKGRNLLQVCLDNEIYIPHLCYLDSMEHPPASCRLCFVEIEGANRPVPSCRIEPQDGMVVNTQSPAVRHLQRSALQLLLSAHRIDCRSCPANKNCDLQQLAKFLKVPLKVKHLESLVNEIDVQLGHPVLHYAADRCVLCGRCVYVCRDRKGHSLLTFARRGFKTVIGFIEKKDSWKLPCLDCLACTEVCPVSAIYLKGVDERQLSSEDMHEIQAAAR